MKLGLLTAFWKRWELAQIFLDYWTQFELEGVEIIRAGSYSYDGNDWKGALSSRGWRGVECPNKPLGRKLNRALSLLDDCDAVITFGSDDFASRGWVRYALSRLDRFGLVHMSSCYLYSPHLDGLVYVKNGPIGAGRVYRGDLMKGVNWVLWNNGKNRALDASAQQRLEWAFPDGYEIDLVKDIRPKNAFLVDVKTGDPEQKNDNVWGFYDVMNVHGDNYDCEPELLERYLGKETARRIRAL